MGLPKYALISLASKLSLIQHSWGFDNVNARAIMIGYKSFMMEVGLYGNTMDHEYKTHLILVTKNIWYKNVWELVHYFKIRRVVHTDYQLKPVRKGDKLLMSEFMWIGYRHDNLLLLNIMRMHKKAIHLLDIVMCDGKTTMSEMLTDLPGQSNYTSSPPRNQQRQIRSCGRQPFKKSVPKLKFSPSPFKNISVHYTLNRTGG